MSIRSRAFYILSIVLICIITIILLNKLIISYVDNGFISKEVNIFLNIDPVYNYGISFGFLSEDFKYKQIIINLLICVILLVLIFNTLRCDNKYELILQSIVLGGGLGNLYERILNKKVLDYISIHYKELYYPTFNLADIYISTGVVLLFVNYIRFMYINKKDIK